MNTSLNFIRAIAILLVMLGHSIIIYVPEWGLAEASYSSPLCQRLHALINYIQMPLFFTLAGFCFIRSIEKQSLYNFIYKKVRRLIIPFVLVGLLYSIPIKAFLGVYALPADIIQNPLFILKSLFMNVAYAGHLWFLPTLFLIFIISIPVISKQKIILWDVLLLLFLATLSGFHQKIELPHSYFQLLCQYWVFFYTGLLLKKYELTRRMPLSGLILIFTIFIVGGVFCEIPIITSLCLVFLFLYYVPNTTSNVVQRISANSYGLYLFHSPLVYFMFMYYPNVHPFIMFFVNFFVCGSIAYLLTSLIRKTPLRVVIGE